MADPNFPDMPLPDYATNPMAQQQDDIWFRNELIKATKELIEDKLVETKLEHFPLWSIYSKTYKLTFFKDVDVLSQENMFEAEVNKLLRSIPPCRHSSDLYITLGQARMIFHANLRRSLGTNNRETINERTAQISQFKQVVTSSNFSEAGKPGLLRRIFG